MPGVLSLEFRLSAPSLDFCVDVRLRKVGGRWIAVADIAGEHELGLGATARTALTAALSSLPGAAAAALLADPELFDVSRKIAGVAQSAS